MLVLLRRQGEQAGAVRSDDAHATLKGEFDEVGAVRNGNAFGDDHDEPDSGFDGLDHGAFGEPWRHEDHTGLGARRSLASAHVAYTGTETSLPSRAASNVTWLPALRGLTPPTMFVPARSMRAVCVMP